jgi:hypothetical protein
MTTVRLAALADLDRVAAFLARSLGGAGGPPRYRRFFEYAWVDDKPNIGALIEDGGEVHGFLGALYSRRNVRGAARAICNLSSWAADEAYRAHSLGMLKCLLEQRGYTFTTFSASPPVADVLRFFKFQTLRSDRLLFTPLSGRLRRRDGGTRVVDGAERVEPLLDSDERQLLLDHRPYRCGHVLIEAGNRRCYAITIARGRSPQVFADVLYASDPQLFVDSITSLQAPLFRAHRTILTGIELRRVERPPTFALCYTGLRPTMFRTDELDANEIRPLHSELVLMYG